MLPERYSFEDLNILFLDRVSTEGVQRSLTEFYETVRFSEEFSWMGVFQTKDQLERTRWIIYLCPTGPIPAVRQRQLEMLPSFVSLSLAMRRQTFLLDLGFTHSSTYKSHDELLRDCIDSIRETYGGGNPNWGTDILWETDTGQKS